LISQGVPSFVDAFTQRFQEAFPVPAESPPGHLAFSKAITSNLFGGIGYFYGSSIVDRAFKHEWDQTDDEDEEETVTDQKPKPKLQSPRGLLTATPSRPFFPRGFYWYARYRTTWTTIDLKKGRGFPLAINWRMG
jgi:mannosyl-oligosaccharide glucosidase